MHSLDIDISFRATKIFAQLCSDGMKFQSIESMDFSTILAEIVNKF
jgi:hypothetical protein